MTSDQPRHTARGHSQTPSVSSRPSGPPWTVWAPERGAGWGVGAVPVSVGSYLPTHLETILKYQNVFMNFSPSYKTRQQVPLAELWVESCRLQGKRQIEVLTPVLRAEFVSPQDSCVETLTRRVVALGGGSFGRWLGHEVGAS